MNINIHELNKKSEVTFDGEQPVSLRGTSSDRPIICTSAHVSGKVSKTGNKYVICGKVNAEVSLICDRCLETFLSPIEADLFKVYSSEAANYEEDEDIIQLDGFEIDLEDSVTEALYLNLPMKWLHDVNCKGICKVCGNNLNKQSCKCIDSDSDPRLEGLKNIFHPQSEE